MYGFISESPHAKYLCAVGCQNGAQHVVEAPGICVVYIYMCVYITWGDVYTNVRNCTIKYQKKVILSL